MKTILHQELSVRMREEYDGSVMMEQYDCGEWVPIGQIAPPTYPIYKPEKDDDN